MPSCNLAETVHNKWLQASGNKGGDLYVAAVDDYIRAFLQVVAYYQYLKGGVEGMGPSREELRLRSAQRRAHRTGDPGVIQSALLGMPRADDFCTRDPHHEGAEVFGSQKRKPDTPFGADDETHRPDTISFSRPPPLKRVTRARAATLPTIPEEVEPCMERIQPLPPVGTDIRRITAVLESTVNKKTWHIARVPKTSAKACWAQMAVTKKKCTARIVLHGKSTPAPTYSGAWRNVRLNREDQMQFFFCSDDIERCVKGSHRKWIIPYSDTQERPPVPTVWLVKIGTNLTRSEIVALENAGFQLPQRERVPLNRSFNNFALPMDFSSLQVPENPDHFLGTRKSKCVRRSNTGPSSKQLLSINSAMALEASILKVTMIPQLGFGCIISLQSKPSPTDSVYQLTVSSYPDCTYPAFKETMSKFGRRGFAYKHCKHLYYILVKVCALDPEVDLFIHAPTFSFNKIRLVLERGILIQCAS